MLPARWAEPLAIPTPQALEQFETQLGKVRQKKPRQMRREVGTERAWLPPPVSSSPRPLLEPCLAFDPVFHTSLPR